MNQKLIRLIERREHLVAQAAAQRTALAGDIQPWRARLAVVDQGLAGLRFLKRHPAWLVGGVVLVAAVRPGSVGRWLERGWLTWRIMVRLRGE